MLANFTKTQNFTGVSAVDVEEGKGTQVLYMNAAVSADGAVSFSEQIRNIDLYKAHKKEVDADLAAFKKAVFDSVGV